MLRMHDTSDLVSPKNTKKKGPENTQFSGWKVSFHPQLNGSVIMFSRGGPICTLYDRINIE